MQNTQDHIPTAVLYHMRVGICDLGSLCCPAGYTDYLQFMKGREPIILPRKQPYETPLAFKLRHEQWLAKHEREDSGFINIYAWLIFERNLESRTIHLNITKVDEKRDC